ncbi:MAG: hypothetical protein V4792_15050 [Pseudomonadota bacterium]
MPAVRYLVDDFDAALVFYRVLGFKLADRWGPPFETHAWRVPKEILP